MLHPKNTEEVLDGEGIIAQPRHSQSNTVISSKGEKFAKISPPLVLPSLYSWVKGTAPARTEGKAMSSKGAKVTMRPPRPHPTLTSQPHGRKCALPDNMQRKSRLSKEVKLTNKPALPHLPLRSKPVPTHNTRKPSLPESQQPRTNGACFAHTVRKDWSESKWDSRPDGDISESDVDMGKDETEGGEISKKKRPHGELSERSEGEEIFMAVRTKKKRRREWPTSGKLPGETGEGAVGRRHLRHIINERQVRREARIIPLGEVISVYWPYDDQYYTGKITEYDDDTIEHKVEYEDGDIENLVLDNENWLFGRLSEEGDEDDSEEKNDSKDP